MRRAENIEGAGVITLENAGKHNAMNQQMFRELDAAIEECEKDGEISVVILTGKGIHFCAGYDVGEIYELAISGDRELADRHIGELRRVAERLASSKKPTIAVINGYCLGGGLELALACRARVASSDAKFGFPEIDLGLIPGIGGTQRLPRLIGLAEAFEILAGGKDKIVSSRRAEELGIVDKVLVPEGEQTFMGMAKAYVQELRGGALKLKVPKKTIKVSLSAEFISKLRGFAKDKSPSALAGILFSMEGLAERQEAGMELEHKIFIDLVFSDDALRNLKKFLRIPEEPKNESAPDGVSYEPIRSLVRDFAKREISPLVSSMEENREIPRELFAKMGELGFIGAAFPERFGGLGMGLGAAHIIAEELARAHASLAVMYGAHSALACGALNIAGSEAQKQKHLVPAIKGEKIGAFALTEESGGSDVAGIKTSAKKEGSDWILKGTKQFITNGTIADFVIVFAQTDPLGGNKTITAFIVERGMSGFTATNAGEKIGLYGSDTAALDFKNVRVPEENVLGEVGQGFKIAMTALNGSRLGLCAVALGEAKEAFELASKYSASRKVEGEPLYMKQITQERLAEMSISVFAIEVFLRSVTAKVEAGVDARREIAEAKVFCTADAMKVIDMALQVFGGVGYMDECTVSRIWRDARVNLIFDGTNEINKLLAAKEIIKNLALGRSALERS